MNKGLIFIIIFIGRVTFGQNIENHSMLLNSLKKLDISRIKNQPYLKNSIVVNCDSPSGSTIDDRICANLELQKQDSLLQIELKDLINEIGNDSTAIKRVIFIQEIWERYRYALCDNCIIDQSSYEMIAFMKCLSEVTKQRRKDFKNACSY